MCPSKLYTFYITVTKCHINCIYFYCLYWIYTLFKICSAFTQQILRQRNIVKFNYSDYHTISVYSLLIIYVIQTIVHIINCQSAAIFCLTAKWDNHCFDITHFFRLYKIYHIPTQFYWLAVSVTYTLHNINHVFSINIFNRNIYIQLINHFICKFIHSIRILAA